MEETSLPLYGQHFCRVGLFLQQRIFTGTKDMAMTESRGVAKLLLKIDDAMRDSKFYEAHQIYRTLYFRFSKQDKHRELADLLLDGASRLLATGNFQSGSDLGLLLIETLHKCQLDELEFEAWILKLSTLIGKIESNVVEREQLIVKAIKWSCEGNQNRNQGHPAMHKQIGIIMANEKNFECARYHYLLSKDGVGCAKILMKIAAYRSELDMVIAQTVLTLLVLKEKNTAKVTFSTFTSNHPQIRTKNPPYRTPLLNFVYFLLNIIDDAKLPSFKALCELYKTALSRDPAYEKQLQQIGVSYFGAQAPRANQNTGLFGGLFQIFQELEDSDESDESSPNNASSSQFRSNVDLD